MPSSVSTLTKERTQDAGPVGPPAPARSLLRGLGSWASVAWFLVPALVLFLVFVLAPIAVAVYTGFFKWGGVGPLEEFVGFGNYATLFRDQVFLGDLERGLYLITLSITVQLPFALFTAVLLNQRLRGRAVYRMLFFAPYILSEVVTAVLFTMIFLPGGGMADHLAGALGLEGLQGKWLADPSTVMPTLFVVMTWKYFGLHMMLFLAGLQSIPGEILEAASIDGAGCLAALPARDAAVARPDDPDQRLPFGHRRHPALRPRLGHDRGRAQPLLRDDGDLDVPVRVQALPGRLRQCDQRGAVHDQSGLLSSTSVTYCAET